MAEDNKNTIIFRIGEETGIVIEKTKEQFEHSLFKEQYKQALSLVNSIISRSKDADKDAPMSNIVAFCGDRGEGKTSAMMTIRNILVGADSFEAAKEIFPSDNKIEKNSFKVLRLVDPAFFDSKHNLLELLIGQMYADIRKDDDGVSDKNEDCDCGMNINVAHRNKLMQLFHNVHRSLGIINKASDKSAYDNLEEVDDLAAGIELKEDLNKLVRCYAKYFGKDRVLISIDDLDLNVTDGYQMAEEIRKYLSSPDACIILMSIKIEQMEEVVQSYIRNKMSKDIISNLTIKDMSTRYVVKLIPQGNRVIMPSGEDVVERPLKLAWEKDKKEYPPVKEVVVQYIYNKTGYIFINGRNISPIVPTNLRAVRYLIGMLSAMPNAKDDNQIDNLKNKEDFKEYFYSYWKNNLTNEENLTFVEALAVNEDVVSINKSVVGHLKKILFKQDSQEVDDAILKDILEPFNAMQNISLGDVFYVLSYVENTSALSENKILVFFLRAYYSLKLYDLYNIISESNANLFPDKTGNVAIYKYDIQLQKRNMVQRLVNGSYFTYDAGCLIPSDKRLIPRDKRVVNGKELVRIFKNLKSSSKNEYLLCEFFALTTSYPAYAWQGIDYDRKLTSRSYFDSFAESNQYIVFDILSIFYNIINLKQTYQRWNEIYNIGRKEIEKRDFYEDSLNNKNSLLNAMLKICEEKHNWSPRTDLDVKLHYFISEAIIRISEVQLAIIDNLINSRNQSKTGGNLYNIQNAYQNIRNIGIKLYPNREGTDIYEMEFWFLEPIIQYLSDKKRVVEEDFNKIFQVEVTKKSIIKSLETALGGNILGLSVTSSFSGMELRERISQLKDADLLEEIEWDSIFRDDEYYTRQNVIDILSQSQIYEKIRSISVSVKTREDAVKIASERAVIEASKIFSRFTTEMDRRYKQMEKSVDVILKNLDIDETKKKPGRPKKKESTVVAVAPNTEEKTTES